ncbi:hypothetical protein ACFPPD_13320 [Cohnella suwonensis]|uniref:Flagellar protein FliT n=1 Tax=Cohnella suwonensis TaxID=696072 RepID=A0ABW0LXP3_9BACL
MSQPVQTLDYERFERLVELRQTLTDTVGQKGQLTPQEKNRIREILQYDQLIMQHMQQLKDEAALGLNRVNTSKKQQAAYLSNGAYDSFLFDKRK